MEFPKKWSDAGSAPMSIEVVSDVLRKENPFRVYERTIPKGSFFSQVVNLRLDVFVRSGRISYKDGKDDLEVPSGHFISLAGGSYSVHVSEDMDAEIIMASYAPAEFLTKV